MNFFFVTVALNDGAPQHYARLQRYLYSLGFSSEVQEGEITTALPEHTYTAKSAFSAQGLTELLENTVGGSIWPKSHILVVQTRAYYMVNRS